MVTSPARRRSYEDRGLWTGDTLIARVAGHAARQPHGLAVVDRGGSRRATWAQLHRDAEAVATALRRMGVQPGDVVSVQLPNTYETVVCDLAALSVPAVLNPLLPNYRARELTHVFATARPRVIFTPGVAGIGGIGGGSGVDGTGGPDYRALVTGAREAAGSDTRHVVVGHGIGDGGGAGDGHGHGEEDGGDDGATLAGLMATTPDEPPPGARGPRGSGHGSDARAVSELIFTSGTEATPKPIMHTEQTANFSVRAAQVALGVAAGDVVWMPSPIGHSTGLNFGVRMALYFGLPLVLQERWDPEEAARLIESERCAYTLAATTFLKDLLGAAGGRDLRSMRHFGCGGAPVPPELVDEGDRRGLGVLRLYGSTEALVATWNRPGSPAAKRRHTDGFPLGDIEVAIRDDEGRAVPGGEAGELHVRGPDTCVGFFADPDRTAATFLPDGWVRSGDLCTVDGDGYLTVVGRKKEIIIRGGMNIAPREVEDLLTRFPEVDRAAVVGVPDDRLGERSCACLVLAAGRTLDLETVVARLRAEGLASYKLPEQLHLVDTLPTTASGKVQKHELVRRVIDAGAGTDAGAGA